MVTGGPVGHSRKKRYAIVMGLHDGGTLGPLPAGPEHRGCCVKDIATQERVY